MCMDTFFSLFFFFLRLGGPPVTYINLIRDPLSRAVSHFYFRRHGDGILGKSRVGRQINNTDEVSDAEAVNYRISYDGTNGPN